jgi:hypothetical protein
MLGPAAMADIADIFEQLVQPEDASFSPELAQYVLSLRSSPRQVARYEDLAERVQDDYLTADERTELDPYVHANAILGMMKAKARRSLDCPAGARPR